MNSNMKNRVCMVTGATAGIGKATAMGLADMGTTVIVVGRNRTKAEAVAAEISSTTGNARIEAMVADFSSLEQVRRLAAEFKARFDRLDVLVNNAGLVTQTRQESADGYELMFAVNYLAPFVLTNLLLEPLQAAAPARVVNVSSFGYKRGVIDFEDLQSEQSFDHRQSLLPDAACHGPVYAGAGPSPGWQWCHRQRPAPRHCQDGPFP